MSYVRRQRLSWARIKLSCLWYLYFININLIWVWAKSSILKFLVVYNYRLVSLKGYLLFTFQCTFLIFNPLPWTRFILTQTIVSCQHFFKKFFKSFFDTFLILFVLIFYVQNRFYSQATIRYFITIILYCQHLFKSFFKKF